MWRNVRPLASCRLEGTSTASYSFNPLLVIAVPFLPTAKRSATRRTSEVRTAQRRQQVGTDLSGGRGWIALSGFA